MLSSSIRGIGVLGPGLADWDAAAAVLCGRLPYVPARTELPAAAVLPPAERRRAGRVVRLALAIGTQAIERAGIAAADLPTVFASSGGDGDNCHEICVALASRERTVSPTRFHNSVHNAASGYWSIAQGCAQPSTALCAHDASFGAGLLEAMLQLHAGAAAVLVAAYDVDYPPPLREQRAIPDAFGVALVLSADDRAGTRLRLTFSDAPATTLDDAGLEALRRAIPAARSLPLLCALAQGSATSTMIEYLPGQRMRLELAP